MDLPKSLEYDYIRLLYLRRLTYLYRTLSDLVLVLVLGPAAGLLQARASAALLID